MTAASDRKDPGLALFLSLIFPGSGYAYVGDVRSFLIVLAIETFILCAFARGVPGVILFLVVHAFASVAARGAARVHNDRVAAMASDAPPPPSITRRDAPPAVARPAGPPLTPDEFLAELRSLWQGRQAGTVTEAEFTARKVSAIERVRAADLDEGAALLEAATALVGAGVLTTAERGRLKLRMGSA